MFPYLRLGPLLIQMPLLALLVGLWGGISLVEQEAKRLKLNPSPIVNLLFYTLVAGILGARIGYALNFRGLYVSQPLSLFALTPTTLSPSAGFVIGLVTFVIIFQYKELAVKPTLDALAPGLAFFMLFVGLAHSLSGDAYGAPTSVPWAIRLWNEYRRPSQFYEMFLALVVLLVIDRRFPKPEGNGINFVLSVSLSAAARRFLEAFRGDSVILPGGFREAQVLALILMVIGLYWMRRWIDSQPSTIEGVMNNES
ncbi:MAG TPA: prolipoprotein diacylglyceryl transferase family protein [Anaerolineales bacterium]|nr:prolipoprotein diacylglyceryl transferase family protein [Anaerolineales bacterium]